MPHNKPKKAFILAAGKGTRLRPYTDTLPKPMVEIAGKSIIARTIQKLAAEGVSEIVVNTHHLADVLEEHLRALPESPSIIISREDDLLETGGGIKKALHHFGDDPFYIINGDALWLDAIPGVFTRLSNLWDEQRMDILLLLQPRALAGEESFVGDYKIDSAGRAQRSKNRDGDHMFAGVRIAHPRIFDGAPSGAFSFLELMDKAEKNDRLFGLPHDSKWYHISTPDDLHATDAEFREKGL